MIFFTVSKNDCGYWIDSISESYDALKDKFPNEKIYMSKKRIISIDVNPDEYTSY